MIAVSIMYLGGPQVPGRSYILCFLFKSERVCNSQKLNISKVMNI